MIGPPYGATHAEAQMCSSIDAAEVAPIPYIILFWGIRSGVFFCLGLSMRFSELEFSVKVASFERRLRGAA